MNFRILPVAASLCFLFFQQVNAGETLITKEYRVPPGFISTPAKGEDSVPVLERLKSMGVEFPQGTSAVFIPKGNRLVVRNNQLNLDLIDALVERHNRPPIVLSVQDEVYSLPILDALELLEAIPGDGERYKKLRALLKTNTAKLERFCVLRAESGERAITESKAEIRYTSGFEQESQKSAKEKITTSVELERRDIGDSLELLAQVDVQGVFVDLEIIASRVTLLGDRPAGAPGIAQPVFQVQRTQTKGSMQLGKPYLLGTLNPSYGDGVNTAKEQRVWLQFLTVRLSEE